MPTNVTPEYRKAEERYRQAKTREEKIAALEEMLAKIPKHKGTEKVQATLKTRLSKLRQTDGKSGGGKRQHITVPREGAAQVALLGPPNAGKSQMLSTLTGAVPEVAAYPFTTRVPQPGMMLHENAQIQLVDLPALSDQHLDGWMSSVLRTMDAALLVADVGSDDVLEGVEMVLRILGELRIFLVGSSDQIPAEAPASHAYLPAYLVGWQADRAGAEERAEILREFYGQRFPIAVMSVDHPRELQQFPGRIFDFLRLIRIYTQVPGGQPDRSRPFIVPRGSTVLEVAERIHKDFAEKLRYARLWGSGQFPGQRVQRDYVLQDEDVLEFVV